MAFVGLCFTRAEGQETSPQRASVGVAEESVSLPEYVLLEERVANKAPAATYTAPVTALRFEPQVDVQSRNFGEAQGDLTIRGGIFEGTGIQVGGMSIFDPQTGHYAVELPIPAQMLTAPAVRTGAAHAFHGLQATAGTVDYGWRRVEQGGEAAFAFGNGGLNRQSVRAAMVLAGGGTGERRVAAEASWARSEADGTVRDGDHDFQRIAGRVQFSTASSETEVFGGYQAKFFGWPNLYTPFGVAETENLQTTLLAVAHRRRLGDGSVETGAYYRRNRDDYEFDRYRPGLFNPYQHETDVSGAFLQYRANLGAWRFRGRGEAAADAIGSTALTYGRFHSRSYWKLGGTAERDLRFDSGIVTVRGGLTWDDTNRDGSAVSPLLEVAWAPDAQVAGADLRAYAEVSGATRVPGYTALNSNPAGGLFRGDPDLGREKSRNAEIGAALRAHGWSARASLFARDDDPLVDWTFSAAAPNARTARRVAIETVGVELLGSRSLGAVDLVASYAYLHKSADYGSASVDASFYALNFPEHRATLAVIARIGAGVELRVDNEYRVQEENLLRTVGGDGAFLTSAGLYWRLGYEERFEISFVVDNLWDDDFQELPAVPAAGRQYAVGLAYRW